jgi:hypothetical protein
MLPAGNIYMSRINLSNLIEKKLYFSWDRRLLLIFLSLILLMFLDAALLSWII